MSDVVLEAKNITKNYRKAVALEQVYLELKRGHIYAFVGVNGAGKTTLMRLIAGLTFPDSGEIKLFGLSGENGLCSARKRIGFMIEGTTSYPNMTAKQNIKTTCLLRNIKDKNEPKKVLGAVDLLDTGRKTVSSFSMGMKQRLSLAEALVGNPELLVLDEPTNGMDPIGIKETCALFKKLSSENGVTMLISSHILDELYQVASDFIFLDYGKIIKSITKEELEREMYGISFENYFEKVIIDNRQSQKAGM